MTSVDLNLFCLSGAATIADAIELMERNQQGFGLLVDEEQRLVNTVTDGDLRRAFYRKIAVTELLTSALPKVKADPHRVPVSAAAGTPPDQLLTLLEELRLRHLPILDADRRVVDIVFRTDLMRGPGRSVQAVIMAGGLGTRLRPLTNDTPKPMLPVGDKPLLEHLVDHIRDSGIRKINVATHYQPQKIQDHFGDGTTFGLDIEYVSEQEPLGTAGALRLLKERHEHILVVNGDILTNVNFRAMVDYHEDQHASATIGVVAYDVSVPFGIVDIDAGVVRSISEKPVYQYFVNAGIYVVNPDVIDVIPAQGRCDMTELIHLLIARGSRVVPFPITEYWLDVGRPEDFETAQQDVSQGRFRHRVPQGS